MRASRPHVYVVLLEAGAERDLRRLDPPTFRRVVASIGTLAESPRPTGCRKLSGGERDWRIRVGDYRVVYEIDDPAREVHVIRVRYRRDVYR
jgi:mRNA interferase RelE/StbE